MRCLSSQQLKRSSDPVSRSLQLVRVATAKDGARVEWRRMISRLIIPGVLAATHPIEEEE